MIGFTTVWIVNATAQVPAKLPKFQLKIVASLTGKWSIDEKNLNKINPVYVSTDMTPILVSLTKNPKFLINIANNKGIENTNDMIWILILLKIIALSFF